MPDEKRYTTKQLVASFHPGWNLLKKEHFNSDEHAHLFVTGLGTRKVKRKRIFGREVSQSDLRYFVVVNTDGTVKRVVQEKYKGQYDSFAKLEKKWPGKVKKAKEDAKTSKEAAKGEDNKAPKEGEAAKSKPSEK